MEKMTDKELAKRLAELSDAFSDMCVNRDCEGCEMEAFADEGVCSIAWVWKRMKEEEAALVRCYSDEGAGTAAPKDAPATADKMKAVQMPKWCKAGQWVEQDGDLAKIVGVYGNFIYILDADTGRHFYRLYHYVKPVRFRPYTYDEAKGLLGKVMEYTFSTGSGYASNAILISRVSCRDDGESFIHSCSFDDWVSYKATIDGVPIGVPEIDEKALKGGEK